jgi:hypothetical protein
MKQAHFGLTVRLLCHPTPLDDATRARLEREATEDYLRDLRAEFDQIESRSCSPTVDEVTASLEELNRLRGAPMSKREYENKRDIVELCAQHYFLRQSLSAGRAALSDGVLPTPTEIDRIRTYGERVLELRMGFADKGLKFSFGGIGGQNLRNKKIRDRGAVEQLIKNEMKNGFSYSRAQQEVARELGITEGRIRQIVLKPK